MSMNDLSLLVVDHNPQTLQRAQQILRERSASITVAESGGEALACLRERAFQVLFVELELPDRSCLGLIWEARRLRPDLRCVILADRATLETSIEALRFGVCDLIQKPIARIPLLTALDRALGAGATNPPPTVAPEESGSTPEVISVPLGGSLKQIERRLIEEVIHRHDGNKTAAARALGMHRKALYRLLDT
jgi:two-component system response regulator RegA